MTGIAVDMGINPETFKVEVAPEPVRALAELKAPSIELAAGERVVPELPEARHEKRSSLDCKFRPPVWSALND